MIRSRYVRLGELESAELGELFDAMRELPLATCEEIASKADLNEPTFDGKRVSIIAEVGEALREFNEAGAEFLAPLAIPEIVFHVPKAGIDVRQSRHQIVDIVDFRALHKTER